jgi:hypothetical protein
MGATVPIARAGSVLTRLTRARDRTRWSTWPDHPDPPGQTTQIHERTTQIHEGTTQIHAGTTQIQRVVIAEKLLA